MRATAKIAQWNDAKGYGWLELREGRLFLHVSDISKRKYRPKVGDLVAYDIGQDQQGRRCAHNVEQVRASSPLMPDSILFLVVILVVPVAALHGLSSVVPWRMVAGLAVGINVLSLAFYWIDKRRAEAGQWRISEGSLHLLELLGGWPGAFLAQRLFRHKIGKVSYQIVFWLIVLAYEYAALDFLLGWKLAHGVSQLISR
jgi:uncharacterized membrane protein YsdA (DUF1294 family)/cold shock CspA family protein